MLEFFFFNYYLYYAIVQVIEIIWIIEFFPDENTDLIISLINNNIYYYFMALKLNVYYMLFKFLKDIELYRKIKIQQFVGNFIIPFITKYYILYIYKMLVKIGVTYKKYKKIIRYGYLKTDKRKEYYYRFFEIGSFRVIFLSLGLIIFLYIWKRRSMYRVISIMMFLIGYYFMTLFMIYILSCFLINKSLIALYAIISVFFYFRLFKIN